MRRVYEIKDEIKGPIAEIKENILDTKDNTDIIQEQLLVLMDAIAELYETVALGGE